MLTPTLKGQTTVPSAVHKALNLKSGDMIKGHKTIISKIEFFG